MDESGNLTTLNVIKLPGTNLLRLEQLGGRGFFRSSDRILLIGVPELAYILTFLIKEGYVSKKVLEGILAEVTK